VNANTPEGANTPDGAQTPEGMTTRGRLATLVRHSAADVAIGVMWAALIVAIVLFSGVATQFVYVDF
jgi:hypothetical protein